MDVLDEVERQLVGAVRRQLRERRSRRRRGAIALAVLTGVVVAVSAASAISGSGPIADVLGVERDDPTLRSVREVRGGPRAVVRVLGDDRHLYTFAAFHARQAFGDRGRAVCSTQTRDDATRIPGLGCIGPDRLAGSLRREAFLGGPLWGSSQAGGLRVTTTASGFVRAGARSVTLRRNGGPAVAAELSEPMPISLRGRTDPAEMRAFLAVISYDNDGAAWLGPPARNTVTVELADGTTTRRTSVEPRFFPMVDSSRREGALITMRHAGNPAPWRSVAYVGEHGTLCNAAGPVGERLMTVGKLQCSSPLAVINALDRYGAALYVSDFNPRRERGRRGAAVFGFTRVDARRVTIVDRRGRRYAADLSRPWTTARRRPGDLDGLPAELRRRLGRLPAHLRLRSYITSVDVPPEPLDRGLRLVVETGDGSVLRAGPP